MNGWSILRGLLTGINLDTEAAKATVEGIALILNPRGKGGGGVWKEGIDMLQLAIQFCLREEADSWK